MGCCEHSRDAAQNQRTALKGQPTGIPGCFAVNTDDSQLDLMEGIHA